MGYRQIGKARDFGFRYSRFESEYPSVATIFSYNPLFLFGNGVEAHVMYNPTVHKRARFDSLFVKYSECDVS